MRENILYVPLRKTEAVTLSDGLKQCIEKDYNQHPDRFAKDLDQIDRLRNKIVDVQPDTNGLHALYEYAAQLFAVSAKFPSDIQVELTWYNTLGYAGHAAVRYSLLFFDLVNVVYNIGALLTQLGVQQPGDQQEGQKRAYNYFQQAAGVYRHLVAEILPLSEHPMPIGLDAATLETLSAICLAQAQESFWQKAVGDGIKNGLVAKLAAQVCDFYAMAVSHSNRSNSIRSEWVHHMSCKRWHFEAASQYRAAVDCLDKSKYGEEVARLKQAVSACKHGLMNSKYASGPVLDDLQGLYNKAASDLARAEKDNDLIYLQDVPDASNAQLVSRGQVMSRAVVPTNLANYTGFLESINDKALFEGVLPYAVYQAARVYAEQLDTYIYKNVASDVNKLLVKMHETLAKLELPGSLDAVEKPLGIPQALLNHSEDIRSRGGVARLKDWINDVNKLSTEAFNLITEAKDTLDVEKREDEMMRMRQGTERWNRPASNVAGKDLWERYDTNRGYLNTATNSDKLVVGKLDDVSQLLTVLENGRPTIAKFVPNTNAVELNREVQKIISELREALGRSRSLEVYWQQRLSQLQSSVNNVDLLPAMEQYFRKLEREDPQRKVEASMFEPVYQEALARYDSDVEWARQQEKEMDQILDEIKRANRSFVRANSSAPGTQERQQAIQALEIAHDKYQEIQSNLEEGLKFYNSVLEQLKVFLNDCKTFVYERRVEGRNLEIDIRSENSTDPVEHEHLHSVTPVAPTPFSAGKFNKTWTADKDIKFG